MIAPSSAEVLMGINMAWNSVACAIARSSCWTRGAAGRLRNLGPSGWVVRWHAHCEQISAAYPRKSNWAAPADPRPGIGGVRRLAGVSPVVSVRILSWGHDATAALSRHRLWICDDHLFMALQLRAPIRSAIPPKMFRCEHGARPAAIAATKAGNQGSHLGVCQ